MTSLHQLLDDFSKVSVQTPEIAAVTFNEADLEGQKLEAFENGYRAGWDDAVKAQSDDRSRISSAFGQHLQDLSFTYHEAYSQVMNAMAPLLDEMVAALLPQMARETLGHHIVEQLRSMAQEIGALKVVVAVAPSNTESVAPLLEGEFSFPIQLIEDDTLADEQADIRLGQTEKQIDLGDLIASVSEAVDGFSHDNRRKLANG
ncbi:ABC transporter ATP-binding protein [uncultured Pelagimonas sp.]|uniref:ABC transporter ATP-binding protein n=1 Tax=uncultured Pelagimonas sp. TaxID=1618102 RepID=UPI00260BBCFF|nr:ABC transporter ATP-binding protein [uncultured Pelagimonas sp.]